MQKDFSEIAKKLGWKSICAKVCEAPYPDTHELEKEKTIFFELEAFCKTCNQKGNCKFLRQMYGTIFYNVMSGESPWHAIQSDFKCIKCNEIIQTCHYLDDDYNIILDN